jgi:hypothetical protein
MPVVLFFMKSFNIKESCPDSDLPVWLWLYLPVGLVSLQLAAVLIFDSHTYSRLMEGEPGLIENLTVVLVLGAAITGILVFNQRRYIPSPAFRIFTIVFIAGCIYIAGEEISWGQHYLQWETPERMLEINRQKETNLHNIHKIFGVAPKILLEWTIYLTGAYSLIRVYRKKRAYHPERDWQYWYLPTCTIIVTSALAFMYRIVDRIENWFHLDFPVDPDEMHECLIAAFLLLYILSVYRRLGRYSEESTVAGA